MPRYCRVCHKEFRGKTNSTTCSEKCREEARSQDYAARLQNKQCKYCDQPFLGTKQQRVCENCRGRRYCNWKEIEVPVVCPKCKNQTGTITRKVTHTSERVLGTTCEACKIDVATGRSERMRSDANPAICLWGRNTEVKMTPEEVLKFLSDRMVGDKNPMKNPEVVAKAVANRGKTKKGKNHGNWKGNRDRCQVIRSRLYPVWIKPILERDNFTCQGCKRRGGRLEVHHTDPTFKEVVEKVLGGRSIEDLTWEDFEAVCEEVLVAHSTVKGITCCPACHKLIDPQRH